ncbi:MAG: S-layer homology domain-containing protein [Firmicutes bacterium]|nr:S-layer homology domain-containing protein [Bacillota bacterium]
MRRNWYLRPLLMLLAVMVLFRPSVVWAADDYVLLEDGNNFTVINTVDVANRSGRPIKSIYIRVPLTSNESVHWQEVLGEEFYPQPQTIEVAEDGSRTAVYYISEMQAGDKLQLVHRVAVRNYCVSYDVSGAGTAEIPQELSVYLQPSADINSDAPEIVAFAGQAVASSANPYLQARLLFAAVNERMTYDNSPRSNHSALAAYNIGSGNCEDYANLYVAALRAVGIPARVCSGYLYGEEARTNSNYLSDSGHINGAMLRHNWVEFYIPGTGWLVADPTSANITDHTQDTLVDWDHFARILDSGRLVYTCDYFPDKDIISYEYQGAAPLLNYTSELALYSVVLPFSDLAGHWAAESVLGLYYHTPQVLRGVSENYFGVNQYMTRAELATMLNRVLDDVAPLASWPYVAYSDLSGTHWAYNEISKAVARGILTGYPDGTVRPDALVSRVEAAVMLSRVIGGSADDADLPYNDLPAVGYGWARDEVANLHSLGIMNGIRADKFAPQQLMTRGEGAAAVYRWLNSPVYYDRYDY